jgi:miniconductance mechanosensitive channel
MSDDIELVPLLADFLSSSDFLTSVFWLVGAAVSYVVLRLVVVRLINWAMERTATEWDDILVSNGVFRQLAFLAPALVLYFGILHIPWIEIAFGRRVILAYVTITVVFVLIRLMSAGVEIYGQYPISHKRPIKGWVQVGKLVLYILGAITTISVLLDKSPWGILGGIGALSAILILVFRDTILSLLASIQLVGNDLIALNDWIEVPECGADGSVIDISLYTVKVQNWDKTIVAIPTSKLIDGSFKNWRGMSESGGRRIKRSLLIDQTSVRFCDQELIEKLWRVHLLRPYLEAKQKELEGANGRLEVNGHDPLPLNRRALTNLGTFRAYVVAYLNESAKVHDEMTLIVRQLAPSPEGLPLEIYSFSNDTDWVKYESIQSDIFDHLLGVLPYFDLRVFQVPSGRDFQALARRYGSEISVQE